VNDDFLTQSKTFQILDTTYRRTKEGLVWGYELTAHRTGVVKLLPWKSAWEPDFFDGSDRAEDCDDPSRERHEYPGRVRSPGTTLPALVLAAVVESPAHGLRAFASGSIAG